MAISKVARLEGLDYKLGTVQSNLANPVDELLATARFSWFNAGTVSATGTANATQDFSRVFCSPFATSLIGIGGSLSGSVSGSYTFSVYCNDTGQTIWTSASMSYPGNLALGPYTDGSIVLLPKNTYTLRVAGSVGGTWNAQASLIVSM